MYLVSPAAGCIRNYSFSDENPLFIRRSNIKMTDILYAENKSLQCIQDIRYRYKYEGYGHVKCLLTHATSLSLASCIIFDCSKQYILQSL